ncbi:MAG: pyruvate formate lyase family protein [Dehalococcoidia bacterium]|nr:pyruvate formate lyase family protein [Dehalococcoidia bacterium]
MSHSTLNDLSLRGILLDNLPRLKELRQRHFASNPEICTELPRWMTRYMKSVDNPEDSPELRAGKRLKYMLENKRPLIPDENLLAGTTTTRPVGVVLYPDFLNALSIWPELETIHRRKKNPYRITREEIKELNFEIFPYWMDRTVAEVSRKIHHNPVCHQVMERIVFFVASKAVCISHTIPDFSAVVERGLKAVRNEAEAKEKALGSAVENRQKTDFYQAVRMAIDGVLSYAQNLSREAGRMAEAEIDASRKRELEALRDICARVPGEKPQTFREALNAVWVCWIALHQENANVGLSLGRLDQTLYELYRNDIDSGNLTPAGAVELIGCFWLKIADHVPVVPETGEALFGGTGSNQAITLGGVDMQGNDAVNDLTYVMLRATEILGLRDPNVNCRYYPGVNPPEYLRRLCEVNVNTGATPCFHNDVSVIESLMGQGVTLEHARDYASVGCVEPASNGRTFGHSGAILMNLTSPLEMALFQGKHRLTEDEQIGPVTPALDVITSFEEFKQAFEIQMGWLIEQAVTLNNDFGKVHQMIHPTPLLSAMTEGCLQNDKDVVEGGATYNSSGVAIIGLSEVVDSLTAIQEFVFNKKSVTLSEMVKAINENWEGSHQKLHKMVKTSTEKFGTDSRLAKENADYILDFLYREFQSKQNYRGGKYTVGYWTMTYHAGFALLTGALPSGRVKGEPLPSGITPVSGSAPELTPCLNFVAGLDHTKITNGHALNLKYTPSENRELTITKFAQSVEAYMRTGGLQVQFNIISRETLEDARNNPANYPDLLVRVSGYTAYFVDLNPTMQGEIITRAEYNLEKGREVIFP